MSAFYRRKVFDFLSQDTKAILGDIVECYPHHQLLKTQKDSWLYQIELLKSVLVGFDDGAIAFEFPVPRRGKRIDAALIYKNLIFVLEFKIGPRLIKHMISRRPKTTIWS